MKFLVLWKLDLRLLSTEVLRAVLRMPDYAEPLQRDGKVAARYHIIGRHGGAWIYDVGSNEELEVLLAKSPVYNYAEFEVLPLAEMQAPPVGPQEDVTG